MDVKEIKRLLEAMVGSDATELELVIGEFKLSVKRGAQQVLVAQPAPVALPTPAAAVPVPTPANSPAAAQAPPPAPATSHLVEVTAPIVGTFYASPSPETPAYVKVGDRVTPGTVLCIIEAMKLMNEIEAEVAGVVKEILVRNEEPVEYGQVLFRIEPS
jgi:acetyl-CoA carboxylase biotin carboxyl carrier protein